jgi:hypothetical protein
MRVIVQIISGPATGGRMALGPGQTLQVGRTEWADFAVPKDGQMSSVHFALETDYAACYIKDLGSTNGTFLNRKRLKPQERVQLADGAEILAGRSVFSVQIQAASGESTSTTSLQSPLASSVSGRRVPKKQMSPAYIAPAPIAQQRTFTVEKCDSGLTLCRGSVDEISPGELAVTVCSALPAHLIVDFHKLGSPRPAELAAPNYLFDWLEPQAADLVSPIIVSQDEYLSWPTLIDEGWGNDGVVCLFSRQEKPALVDHLRGALHKGPADAQGSGIVGYCWPSVLGPLLSYSRPQFVKQLLAGIDAVQVELPDLPDAWQIYGGEKIAKVLGELGFQEKPPEGAASGRQEKGG